MAAGGALLMLCWGGAEIKSEEMTVEIKAVIDKAADAVCYTPTP